ncbi:MAG: hypothetical protein ABIS16_08035 [Sphingomicrobium sp.]
MLAAPAAAQTAKKPGHYLFVWAADQASQGNDFMMVVDADPASTTFGRLLTSVGTDQKSVRIHHTEYVMPQSGMLFANDHDANRTFIFDLRDPLKPRAATSFSDLAGYSHPHSFMRLPNGHVLATFQHAVHGAHHGGAGKTGGLVEIDDAGKVVRSVSSADPAFPDGMLMPYSLVVLPEIDRVLSTNSSMHDDDLLSGNTYQLWRLSDLKLIKTDYFDPGEKRYGHISPEEARVGPDGAVYVQTLACGIERVTGLDSASPKSKLVHLFPGNWCGVPTIIGHYLVQSVPSIHGYIVLDIADGARPVEVSRLIINDKFEPHWTGWDAKSRRLIVTSGRSGDRMYLLKLDEATGALSIDNAFRDADGQPGFSFGKRDWPHGWTGEGKPHGAVFSR